MKNSVIKTDIVVIGSGATGMAAALTAAEGRAKVMLFEKQRSLGGTSNFFEGTFAVESDMQRERYITYSRDEAFKNMMEYCHWRANARLVRAFVNESAATITWLQKQGVVFTDATALSPGGYRTYHTIKGLGEAFLILAFSTDTCVGSCEGVDCQSGTTCQDGEGKTGWVAADYLATIP